MWNIRKSIKKGDYLYALVPEHPNSTKNGYVLYHRVVMENHIKRLLEKNEVVHHKDHDKKNNDIDNLEIKDFGVHIKEHHIEKGVTVCDLICPECEKEFTRERNKTHIVKPSKLNCTFCSKRCRGLFSKEIQMNTISKKKKERIKKNIVRIYKKYTPP
jgi:hypothetical protein